MDFNPIVLETSRPGRENGYFCYGYSEERVVFKYISTVARSGSVRPITRHTPLLIEGPKLYFPYPPREAGTVGTFRPVGPAGIAQHCTAQHHLLQST